VDGSHVEHAKPAPDLLLQAAQILHGDPTECWYVGDATWDMLASKAARMTAIGVACGAADESQLREAGADIVTTLEALELELHRRELI
jgi:phosphoglycolate phosphatase-like HAD superfamily hydrolase